jgi:hypothetical protein
MMMDILGHADVTISGLLVMMVPSMTATDDTARRLAINALQRGCSANNERTICHVNACLQRRDILR